jgi:hypothetical protein
MQYYVIKFVTDLRQVGDFLRVLRFPPQIKLTATNDIAEILLKVTLITITLRLTPPVSSTNKTDHHNIAEILLKVALNTTNKQT